MPITQIPFQDPVAPPEKAPEQLGLYDTQGWETAYRDLNDDARVPHLLLQLQDDLSRSRRREAAWISIIVHLILIICLYKIEWLEKYLPWHSVVAVRHTSNMKDLTFLELPSDLQKPQPRPNTNIASDKNRTAMTRHPQLDVKELRKILKTPPPGSPGSPAAPQPPAQSAAVQPQNQPSPQPQQAPGQQIARMEPSAKPNIANEFRKYSSPMSAGSAIDEAARAAAARRGGGQQEGSSGDFGLGTGAHGRQMGNLEVLSDTMGVDFAPYLARVLHDVKGNWYNAIPESAQMKKGKLTIEFAITKDGKVAGMKLVATSGDVPLDRAAWAGITASDPFPPLPTEFGGEYLALRFTFFYNPSKEDLE